MANLNAQKIAEIAESNSAILNGRLQDGILAMHDAIAALGKENTLYQAMHKGFESVSAIYNEQFVPQMKICNDVLMQKAEYAKQVERNTQAMNTQIDAGTVDVSGALAGL